MTLNSLVTNITICCPHTGEFKQFEPTLFQKSIFKALIYDSVSIFKERQLGVSTAVNVYLAHKCLVEDVNISYISDRQEFSNFKKMIALLENSKILKKTTHIEQNCISIGKSTVNYCSRNTKTGLKGFRFDIAYFSEANYSNNFDGVVRDIKTSMCSTKSQIIITSDDIGLAQTVKSKYGLIHDKNTYIRKVLLEKTSLTKCNIF